jgi:hypothetical protein
MTQGIEKRIKDAHPVIDFHKIKSEYKQNKKYLKNLSNNSRKPYPSLSIGRIYNCFLVKPATTSLKLPSIDQGKNCSTNARATILSLSSL